MNYKVDTPDDKSHDSHLLCEPISAYSRETHRGVTQMEPFEHTQLETHTGDIRVVELFAGVGGFRIGLERASERFQTVWSNQWEPSTKRQDASIIYCKRFGIEGHSNQDIATVPTSEIPDCDLLCGGFPCQDYSVATTLMRSGGIEGKKGVLWWQIYRILKEKGNRRPTYLMLENVDRLLCSPAKQRGRDFAIILASLAQMGYQVEWRVVNAAEYGMPQRRKRTYIVAYRQDCDIAQPVVQEQDMEEWLLHKGVLAQAFACQPKDGVAHSFTIERDIAQVSDGFNKDKTTTPFKNSGVMRQGTVLTMDTLPAYQGRHITLGDILLDERHVPEEFFIPDTDLPKWEYLKGHKTLKRINKATGYEYNYSEGAMAFPDYLNRASRTIITGEGGAAPSRFKHIVKTASGRYRRLMPIELERLNMFPDNHTQGASDLRRAFLMGNALVTGIVERIALVLNRNM